jgi:hypothetical protein
VRDVTRPIVSVVAPAGYGKTTLLVQWAERSGQAVAWVSLDEQDNDSKVLLGDVARAQDAVRPVARPVFDALASPARQVALPLQPSSDASALLDELEAESFKRLLVFANASDFDLLYPYRSLLGQRCPVPQGLYSIAYNVLVATRVYLQTRSTCGGTSSTTRSDDRRGMLAR